jgi:hypothetical protein
MPAETPMTAVPVTPSRSSNAAKVSTCGAGDGLGQRRPEVAEARGDDAAKAIQHQEARQAQAGIEPAEDAVDDHDHRALALSAYSPTPYGASIPRLAPQRPTRKARKFCATITTAATPPIQAGTLASLRPARYARRP